MVARRSFAAALVLAAAWTVTIKFVLPLAAARSEGLPPGAYVMWDFWWVAHLALAWQLLRPGPGARWFAIAVTWAEIAIIAEKFAAFLRAPVWTRWRTLWFENKCAVLALFVILAWYLHASAEGRRLGRAGTS